MRSLKPTKLGRRLLVAVALLVVASAGYQEFAPTPDPYRFEETATQDDALRELRELRQEMDQLNHDLDELNKLYDLDAQGKLWSA